MNMKNEKVKKTVAAVLAGAMCFGLVGVRQNVTAKQNIRSDKNEKKDSSDRINISSETENGSEGKFTVAGDAFNEKIASLYEPVYNAETGQMEFSYIYFGSYPQSEVTGEALREEIINADYVNGDAVVDGVRYRRVEKKDAYYTLEQYVEDYMDEWGFSEEDKEKKRETYLKKIRPQFYNWDDGCHYFKYEPIKWKVTKISSGEAALVSENALDAKKYLDGDAWMKDTKESGFIGNVFDEEEKNMLLDVLEEKEEVIEFDEETGIGYKNYITVNRKAVYAFASEFEDYISGIPGMDSDDIAPAYVAKMSDYAFAMGGMQDEGLKGNCRWWLYNTGLRPYKYAYAPWVSDSGICNTDSITETGLKEARYETASNKKYMGVVPKIKVCLTRSNTWESETRLSREDVKHLQGLIEELRGKSTEKVKETMIPHTTETPEQTEGGNSQQPQESEPVHAEYPKGDVNGDFIVNLKDAQLALKAALNLVQLDEDQARRAAVTERSGITVTLKDAQCILKWALNLL